MTRALLALALALAAGGVPAAEPLGRLFFTPVQRAQLDAARSQKSRGTLALEQEEAAPVPEVVTYGGIVRRNDGKTTVWINNRAVNDGKPADRLPVASRVRPDGSINLEVPQTNRSVNLKVGQSVEIVSGTIEEPYARSHVAAKPVPKTAASRDNSAAAKPEGASQPPPGTRKDPDENDQDRR
ncbi:MAG: hypothetical protein A3F74_07665 [Betaproteobacteria bacterium RIFCSPLOWO2_12_FULL_62_58]|nr:MAG: hypothetical protein A3I62_00770 [Betaproteobacteria bacterium RIFCSPLOWO2_02_FULL_62_79]OGA52130.1 MAG: hypothetical protein A3F74_07665 [Betaproteobacteria bacterium RIFCSPLOWO2_12_FULL_62_58]